MQIRNSLLAKGVILFILLSSIAMIWNITSRPPSLQQDLIGVLRSQPKLIKSFNLMDHNGGAISEKIFKDKWSFVFFGYTSCPDICPTTLNVLNAVVDNLGTTEDSHLQRVQVIFISVDPERDTTAKLADYMNYFNKDFTGLSGDKKDIDDVVQQFGAGYMLEEETAPGQYEVGHTSAIFLVAPSSELVAAFSQPHNPATIASQYHGIRKYISE